METLDICYINLGHLLSCLPQSQSNPQQLHNTLLYFVGLQGREREDAIGGGRAGSVHFMANGGVRNEKEKEKEEERSALARSLGGGRGIEGDRLHRERASQGCT